MLAALCGAAGCVARHSPEGYPLYRVDEEGDPTYDVSGAPAYQKLFACGDEYEVVQRVQLLWNDPGRPLQMREERQLTKSGRVSGYYLEPGTRLRVTRVFLLRMSDFGTQRVYPFLEVVPRHPYRVPIMPGYTPPRFLRVDGRATDTLAPHPDYVRKVRRGDSEREKTDANASSRPSA